MDENLTKEEAIFIMQNLLFDAKSNREEMGKIFNRMRSFKEKDELPTDSTDYRIRNKYDNNFTVIFRKLSKIACEDITKSMFDYGQEFNEA